MMADSQIPNVDRVFRLMLARPYYGRVSFGHMFKMAPEDFSEATQGVYIHKFVDQNPKKFGKYLREDGRISMVTTRIIGADFCVNYFTIGCDDDDCAKLHLCKDYVSKTCKVLSCWLLHDITADHNNKILKKLDLEEFTDEEILRLIQLSQPQVCFPYNHDKTCNYKYGCTKLHICAKYVENKCADSNVCALNHSLTTAHEEMILKVFDLRSDDANILDRIIVFPEGDFNLKGPSKNRFQIKNQSHEKMLDIFNSLFKRKRTEDDEDVCGQSSEKEPDADVCGQSSEDLSKTNDDDYLITWEYCIEGLWCSFDHFVLPEIERSYCDPSISDLKIMAPLLLIENFQDESHLHLYFDKMDSMLTKSKKEFKIKRKQNKNDIFYWYYFDARDFVPYDDPLQSIIEQNYQQKNPRCLFDHLDKKVRIKFSEMTQKDRNTGEEIIVRRRPVFID